MITHTGRSLILTIPHIADPTEGTPASSFFAESPAVRAAGRQETMRWQAPEVASNARNVDAQQCAVFSLGILLWEIETGLVPFGELDASNASRQLCSGLLPKMDGVRDDDLRSLIEECLHLNPSERPSLDTVATFFEPKGQTGTKLFGDKVQVIQ
ncbi:hypothetical protein BLNAU_21524 [Blattamonas nauphoetae]|uniref:Protein kinase domain-containing protein n=1 Tax=Blattamonas nauphoetae TaxID=2049346 RepID=A0ABQ9WVP2_9EUKA|nr:hypothetical protein BLNAU_21524 [Blattamonas nauphoetae]